MNYHLSLKSDNRYLETWLPTPKNHVGKDLMKYNSLSVRIWKEQEDIIKKATKVANEGKRPEEQISVAEYVRSRLMPIAAKEAGVTLPDFPAFTKGRPNVAKKAAELLGVDVEQWKRELIEGAAEAVMKRYGSGAPSPRPVVRRRASQ